MHEAARVIITMMMSRFSTIEGIEEISNLSNNKKKKVCVNRKKRGGMGGLQHFPIYLRAE